MQAISISHGPTERGGESLLELARKTWDAEDNQESNDAEEHGRFDNSCKSVRNASRLFEMDFTNSSHPQLPLSIVH